MVYWLCSMDHIWWFSIWYTKTLYTVTICASTNPSDLAAVFAAVVDGCRTWQVEIQNVDPDPPQVRKGGTVEVKMIIFTILYGFNRSDSGWYWDDIGMILGWYWDDTGMIMGWYCMSVGWTIMLIGTHSDMMGNGWGHEMIRIRDVWKCKMLSTRSDQRWVPFPCVVRIPEACCFLGFTLPIRVVIWCYIGVGTAPESGSGSVFFPSCQLHPDLFPLEHDIIIPSCSARTFI